MANIKNEKLERFFQSIQYRDICYFIDHVTNQDIFNSCCEELGYSIGIDIVNSKDKAKPKSVIIGKEGEFRVISHIQDNKFIAECVICRI